MLLCPNWGLIQPAVRREAAHMSQRLEDQAPNLTGVGMGGRGRISPGTMP